MTDGTSQGLFIVVAIVIFGIFVVLAYILFEDTLSPAMANMFTAAIEQTDNKVEEAKYFGANLLIGGEKVVEGPVVGGSGSPESGNTDGADGKEFVQYADLSPIFDTYGLGTYTISFDLKATNEGIVWVYSQNGSSSRYMWMVEFVHVTEDWERYAIVVDVKWKQDVEKSMLAFFGENYRTNRSASIKNVKVERGDVSGVPKFTKAPIWVKYK